MPDLMAQKKANLIAIAFADIQQRYSDKYKLPEEQKHWPDLKLLPQNRICDGDLLLHPQAWLRYPRRVPGLPAEPCPEIALRTPGALPAIVPFAWIDSSSVPVKDSKPIEPVEKASGLPSKPGPESRQKLWIEEYQKHTTMIISPSNGYPHRFLILQAKGIQNCKQSFFRRIPTGSSAAAGWRLPQGSVRLRAQSVGTGTTADQIHCKNKNARKPL